MYSAYSKDTLRTKAKAVISAASRGQASEGERQAAVNIKNAIKPFGQLCVSAALGTDDYLKMDAAHDRIICLKSDAKQEAQYV